VQLGVHAAFLVHQLGVRALLGDLALLQHDLEAGCQRPRRLKKPAIMFRVAYAWPTGEIYLTRGLVELLDDAEIAAGRS
jgi:Zn-dependent protease with chaperone function